MDGFGSDSINFVVGELEGSMLGLVVGVLVVEIKDFSLVMGEVIVVCVRGKGGLMSEVFVDGSRNKFVVVELFGSGDVLSGYVYLVEGVSFFVGVEFFRVVNEVVIVVDNVGVYVFFGGLRNDGELVFFEELVVVGIFEGNVLGLKSFEVGLMVDKGVGVVGVDGEVGEGVVVS